MATLTIEQDPCKCAGAAQAGSLERVRYFPRQILTVEDMVTEQNYFREKMRRHNRYLHGTGVVCGMMVTADPSDAAKWRVIISPGVTIDPQGNQIDLFEPAYFDLARCAAGDQTDPCDPTAYHRAAAGITRLVFVAIKYAECFSKPVRAMAGGCGCEDSGCEYSRIRDSFELGCLPKPPRIPEYSICDLLRRGVVTPCPPEPEGPWVVLAQVVLPASTETVVTQINNNVRHRLFPTSAIQRQVILCCCGDVAPGPAQVSVTPVGTVAPAPLTVNAVFTKNMIPDSVNSATFVVHEHATGIQVQGAVNYTEDTRTAIFTPVQPFAGGRFDVTIRGTGADPAADTDGLVLDGDNDGVAGGDHNTNFTTPEDIPIPR